MKQQRETGDIELAWTVVVWHARIGGWMMSKRSAIDLEIKDKWPGIKAMCGNYR